MGEFYLVKGEPIIKSGTDIANGECYGATIM